MQVKTPRQPVPQLNFDKPLVYFDSNESLIAALQFDAYKSRVGCCWIRPDYFQAGRILFCPFEAKGGANNRPIRLAVAYIIGAYILYTTRPRRYNILSSSLCV